MTSCTLHQIPGSPTRWIYSDCRVVGFLYSPDAHGDEWEIWPRTGCESFFRNWPADRQKLDFSTFEDAEAFLGIRQAVAA